MESVKRKVICVGARFLRRRPVMSRNHHSSLATRNFPSFRTPHSAFRTCYTRLTNISFATLQSMAISVSPTFTTQVGCFWCRRISLPGTIPREVNLSRSAWDFGVMNTIRASSPGRSSTSCVTSGVTSFLNFSQHAPRGIGLP